MAVTSINALRASRGADGMISLREAIAATNATRNVNSLADQINFAINGTGVQTINLTSAFPWITDSVKIDASSQSGYSGSPLIELNGTSAGAGSHGFRIETTNSTIRGFTINRFSGYGVYLGSGNGNTIAGNYIGTNSAGTAASANSYGIFVNSGSNTIGGLSTNDRNVISGNTNDGIYIVGSSATNNLVQGNYIGINAAGTAAIANLNGIQLGDGSIGNTIGGTTTAARNVISGNTQYGVYLTGSNTYNNLIQGNYIGTNAAGSAGIGNGYQGIAIVTNSANNTIGGTTATSGNLIAFNGFDGIALASSAGSGNSILRNSIYSNGGLGIDLSDNGVTANDSGDGDTGPNALQNFPVLTSAISVGGNTTISGSLNSAANTTYRIEFFYSPSGTEDASGYGEARYYLDFIEVTTNGSGNATISALLTGVVLTSGDRVTATATQKTGGSTYSNTSEFAMNVVAVNNSAPINTVPGPQTVNEDTALSITGISVNDTDGNLTSVQLSVLNGNLSVSLAGGATITAGANNSSSLTLGGSQAQINAALATLSYQGNSNFAGSDTLTILCTDSNSATDSDTVAITVTAVNDAPVITPIAPDVTFVEGGLPQLIDSTGTIVDVDSTNLDSGVLTVSISANGTAADRLMIGNSGTGPGQVGLSGSNVTYEGTVIGTFSGGTSGSDPLVVTFNTNATAAAVQEVYRSIQFDNVSDTPSTATRQLTISLTDGDGGTATPQNKLVYVQATNDGPTFSNLNGTPTYTENGSAVILDSDVAIADGELTAANNFSGATLTLVRNGGANSQDVYSATGTLSTLTQGGSLVVGGTTVGTVTTNSSGTLVLTFNSNATNALVNSVMQKIAYSNSSDTPPASAQINWTFNDNNSGAQGTGGALTATGSTTVSITATNDEQYLATNIGLSVAENSTGNVVTTLRLQFLDADNSAGQLVYTVTSVTTNGTLKKSGTTLNLNDTFTQADIDAGNITYDHNGSETSSDSFGFSVDDGVGSASTGTFNFTVTPVNDNTPVITSNSGGATASINVAENSTAVTTVTSTDGDLPAQTITYSISGGADSALFAIDSNTGVLTFVSGRNRESHTDADSNGIYEVTVRASDGTLFDTQAISVTITDVDEFDTGALTDSNAAANSVVENAANGTVVGITGLASDADATTNTITYSLQNNDGGRFAIDSSTGVVTVAGAINREVDGASRNITVRATSADGSFTDQVFSIAIVDADEFDVTAPTDSNAAANAVNENASTGTVVGITASSSDADATTNTVTYSLFNSDGGNFTIDANTGIVTTAAALNRETLGASRNITVRATSADGSTADTVFTININDLDEFDTGAVTDSNAAANSAAENAANGTVVGITGLASDADATTNAITYSLDNNAGGRFAIDANTGVVTVANGTLLNYEAATSHNITIRATSADTSFSTQSFTINLTDVNEGAVGSVSDSNAAANLVLENASNGTVVGVTGLATDPDGTDVVTYSLDSNAGGRFTIDANTGIVTVNGAIDREAAANYNITIRATSSDTSFSTQSFTINIGDVDEFDTGAVTDTNATANSVVENAANGTVVGITGLASDADATTNTITYSLQNNDGGR
ncbi:MAG: cadherin domain-containing protein, partial [Pirellula sp.]